MLSLHHQLFSLIPLCSLCRFLVKKKLDDHVCGDTNMGSRFVLLLRKLDLLRKNKPLKSFDLRGFKKGDNQLYTGDLAIQSSKTP